MPNPSMLDQDRSADSDSQSNQQPGESFGDILKQYERSHSHRPEEGGKGLEGTVITISGENVYLDIGYKTEGIIPVADFANSGETVKPGDKVAVSIKGRNEEGYYQLTKLKVERPKDWSSLE